MKMRKTNKSKLHKSKLNKSRKNRHYSIFGGGIEAHSILKHIKSLGFEIETVDIVKLTLRPHLEEEEDKHILVNSALSNIDLEQGYIDEHEYTYILDTDDEKIKITNDSADDYQLNDKIIDIIKDYKESHNITSDDDDDDCTIPLFKLKVPKTPLLSQTEYDIYFIENSEDLINCSTFTDTEFIATYYNPNKTSNTIMDYLEKTTQHIKTHLTSLKTITNTKLLYRNEDTDEYSIHEREIDDIYVLPGTTLVYMNMKDKFSTNKKYDIKDDMTSVIQMTFACDITQVYKLMTQMTTYLSIPQHIDKETVPEHIMDYIKINYDTVFLTRIMDITKTLLSKYNEDARNKNHQLIDTNNNTNITKLKMYLFLIIFKVYRYVNDVFGTKELLKDTLIFAVRHTNYILYKEMKKIVANIFNEKLAQKTEEKQDQIIQKIIKRLVSYDISALLYVSPKIIEYRNNIIEDEDNSNSGDPAHSLSGYFEYFETSEIDEYDDENKHDWLVENNIDVKSSKFDLENDTVIIENRTFPRMLMAELFLSGDETIRKYLSKRDILDGIPIKVLDRYFAGKKKKEKRIAWDTPK